MELIEQSWLSRASAASGPEASSGAVNALPIGAVVSL